MSKIKFAATAAGVYRQGDTPTAAIAALGAFAEYYDSTYAYAYVGKSCWLATISPICGAKTDVGAKRIASKMRKPPAAGKSYLLKQCCGKWAPFAMLVGGKWMGVDDFVSSGA